MCAQGIFNKKKGIYTDACKGDSGGPLTQVDEDGRNNLVGIVSGGILCGKGYPGWYTRVETYRNWILCIINSALRFDNNVDKVIEACQNDVYLRKSRRCEDALEDPEVALFDLRSLNSNATTICGNYAKNTFFNED